MFDKLLLGIDIGTTHTKGVLIDAHGNTLGEASRECQLYSERPNWAEMEPAQWWSNTQTIARELLAAAKHRGATIAAIGVSGMVPALVILDANGRPLRRSIQQNDARTVIEIEELGAEVDGNEFFALTGGSINQQVLAPKLRWLAKREPELLKRARTLLGSYDYINYRLTGVLAVEHNWALESGLYNIETCCWDNRLLAIAGITEALLPAVRMSHEVIGSISDEASKQTGLPVGVPVIAGVADHVSSAFAAGAFEDGDLLIKFGGAGDILYSSGQLVTDPRLFIDYHVIPGKYLINGCMATSGSLIKWYVNGFCHADVEAARRANQSAYAYLDRQAAELPPGSNGLILLPYLLGEKTPLHDPNARGTIVGLGLHHTRYDVYRACLEAVVFGFRHHIDVLTERGLAVRRVLASDGGARSDLWLQIAAAALDKPIHRVLKHTGSSLGAAFTAGKATGLIARWEDIENYIALSEPFEPELRHTAIYDRAYHLYRTTYEQLKNVYPGLAEVYEQASGGIA